MAEWRHLVVVLPGIGGSVLALPGNPDDVVWDAGKGDIADLVLRPDQMSLEESPRLAPLGLTESTKFLGFTVVPGYERLLTQLEAHGKVDRCSDPRNPTPGADVVAMPYDSRRSIVEAAERVDGGLRASGRAEPDRTCRASDRGGAFDGRVGGSGVDGVAGALAVVSGTDHPGNSAPGSPEGVGLADQWGAVAGVPAVAADCVAPWVAGGG